MTGFDVCLLSMDGENSGRMNIVGAWHSYPEEVLR
jgi:hypothetical protein